jgi:hypothetical protein
MCEQILKGKKTIKYVIFEKLKACILTSAESCVEQKYIFFLKKNKLKIPIIKITIIKITINLPG